MYKPLADEIRPDSLEDVVGQQHILGENGMLRRIIESGKIPNMIFYGPSGTGKTTVARIIAERTNRTLRKLNATTAGLSDIKDIIAELDTFLTPGGVLLYLDEIQYFNKKQQQSLLEFIEDGRITLIASTTENPYFCVFNAILSRSTVFEFKSISPREMEPAVIRAIRIVSEKNGTEIETEEGVISHIATSCGGDVRKALNTVEILSNSCVGKDGKVRFTLEDVKAISQRSSMHYDRDGDEHFDTVSALMKSLRGSDPDAALHYLARLLLPEGRLALAEAVILLATSPKSNSVVQAIDAAVGDVKRGKAGPIPRELQNVHADGTGFEREQGYKYPHSYPNHWVKQQYLPDSLKGTRYYEYGDNKNEQAARAYWEKIKGEEH